MKSTIWCITSACALLGTALAETAPAVSTQLTQEQQTELATMKQDAACGQVVVTCLFNGVPLRMMLDTGASHTVLHQESVAKIPGIRKVDTSGMQFSGNAQQRPDLWITDMRTATVNFTQMVVMSINLQGVRNMMDEKIDGVMGMDALQHLPFTFDQREKPAMYWGLPKDVATMTELPGTRDQLNRLHVPVRCGDKVIPMLLDTGASRLVMATHLWPAGVATHRESAVGDVNSDRVIKMGDGVRGDIELAPGIVRHGISPFLTENQPHPLLGMDALRGLRLVHIPARGDKKAAFYISK